MTVPVPVPFDAELLTVYNEHKDELVPMAAELLAQVRAEDAEAVPQGDELSRSGRFAVTERAAPGLSGSPKVPLLICSPVGVPGPHPTIYHRAAPGCPANC